MSSSSTSHESSSGTGSGRNLSSSSSSCSKMANLTGGGTGSGVSSALTASQSASSLSTGNVHCSISQQSGSGGGGGLAPIMEIREMNSYCNSCVTVGADKYWNHHHHHHHHTHHANVGRHTAVYPQMFYTPPPPPHPATPSVVPAANYTGSTGSGIPTGATSNEWSCPPPSTADSYSHFIYSQYPPPPPPPSSHDYNNFLGLSSSCYETDMMMMSSVPVVPGSSAQVQNNCEPSAPAMMNSFMYPHPAPLPPQLSSFETVINPPPPPPASSTAHEQRTPVKVSKPETFSLPPPPPSSTAASSSSTSGDSTDESDDEDDEESSHIISIEDDDNDKIIEDEDIASSPATEVSTSSPLCVLCQKPAPLLHVLPPNAPSPQLSRILDNIDDDELDISVCSGDIEIGGIEDEMIQQETEQQQQKVSLQRLSQLVGVPVTDLTSGEDGNDEELPCSFEKDAVLCSKCQKLVGMAESLEKQLSSVLSSLRQVLSLEDDGDPVATKEFKMVPMQVNSVGIQTEDYDLDHQKYFIFVRRCNSSSSPSHADKQTPRQHDHLLDRIQIVEPFNDNCQYLCHECGRHFSCRRNLGKHLKRHHLKNNGSPLGKSNKLPTCPRENCGKTFLDKAALHVHLRKHTSDKPYFCVTCLKLFTTKSNLTAHIKSNVCREKVPEPIITAETAAAEQFPTVTSTTTHRKDDDGQGNRRPTFPCENCGLTFRTESRFQKHVATKSACNKSKLFPCDICSRLFAKRSELKAHQVVHTRAKSFLCDICGMAFSTRGNQRVHQRTHFSQKRFKCHICDKGFTRNQTLQIHITNSHK